jgi:hypothetical protein
VLGEDLPDLLADRLVDLEGGFTNTKSGHCRLAVTDGIAERTPNLRAT